MNPNQSFETQRKLVDDAVLSMVSGKRFTRQIVPAFWAKQRGGRAWHKGLAASGFSSGSSELTWIAISNWELTRFGTDAKVTRRVRTRIEQVLQGFMEPVAVTVATPARRSLFDLRNLGAAIRTPAAQAWKLAPPVVRCARLASACLSQLRRSCYMHLIQLRQRSRR